MPKTATGHKTATPPFGEIGELLHKNGVMNHKLLVLCIVSMIRYDTYRRYIDTIHDTYRDTYRIIY